MTIIQDIAEKSHFTHVQFALNPLTSLNETACLSCLSRNYIETVGHNDAFYSGALSKRNILQY